MKSISEQLLDNMFKAKRQIQQNQYPLISDEDYEQLRRKLISQDTRWIDDQIKCLNSKKISNKTYRTYFVTTTFYGDGEVPISSKVDYTWDHYFKFYRHLVGHLIKRPKRRPDLHPLTCDYIDFPKSSIGEPLEVTAMPHIHSIYVVDEVIADKFEDMYTEGLDRVLKHEKLNKLATCDVQKINEYPDTTNPHQLFNTIRYSSKYVRPKMKSYEYHDVSMTLCQFLPLPQSDYQKGGSKDGELPNLSNLIQSNSLRSRNRLLHA